MRYIPGIILLAMALLVAGYAQHRLAFHTASMTQLWLGRLMLAGVGLAFGWAMTGLYMDVAEGGAVIAFVVSFGIAHLPAAIILWLKRQRDAPP